MPPEVLPMKIRNTSGRDRRVLGRLLRAAVRDVARTVEPRFGSSTRFRRDFILRECDVWIRERLSTPGTAPARGEEEVTGYNTGRASLGGAYLRLTIGRWSTVSVLWLMVHEAWHLFGLGHEDFPAPVMHETPGGLRGIRERFARLIEDVGEIVPMGKAKPKRQAIELRSMKLAKLREAEARWDSKLGRAERALAKVRARIKRMERTIEHDACPPLAAKRKEGET